MESEAWEVATRAAENADVTLEPLHDLRDADRVRDIIARIWGDEQAIAREMIRALQHAGGVLYGAVGRDGLVGFVLGFVGWNQGLHLHSHMLGVTPRHQSRGVGYALKLAQRAACLDNGIEEIRWTYDPLLRRNARFNLVKLGAVAFAFRPQFYGDMSDRVNRGDLSDRFEVTWRLRDERVLAALARTPETASPPVQVSDTVRLLAVDPASGGPRVERATAISGPVLVAIPAAFAEMREARAAAAVEWRRASGDVFDECFSRGLVATGFTTGGDYVFEPPEQGP